MTVDLNRTFSDYTALANNSDDQDWGEFLGRGQRQRTWRDLHERPLAIVLGEAGIGKTFEFKNETARLRADGHHAFFMPLNLLTTFESWELALADAHLEYAKWANSQEPGYFLLDAVDEARLKSHADFERALAVVQRALREHLTRVHIAVSSRVTDWSSPEVRTAVQVRLAETIERAIALKEPALSEIQTDSNAVLEEVRPEGSKVEAYVVALDPLSDADARRCAAGFSLQEPDRFWAAVKDGEYEYMASRPLDLQWMVKLWNQRRTLGTYRELMEVNIHERLQELNESYETAGEVMSVVELHSGAMELAAAAEFGGRAFLALDRSALPGPGELAPYAVLNEWTATAVRRLLATAIFDEASYGRVMFHHRSVREYLAAEWVVQQLVLGVPLLRMQGLFAGRPFGRGALIPARRAALAWVAALNVQVREWVASEFPEVLLHGGDPQSWDSPSANLAFRRWVEASVQGVQVDWTRSASQYMRVGRSLGERQVASMLASETVPTYVKSVCFRIAWHARLGDCAEVCFGIFRHPDAKQWERRSALDVLQRVGTPEQRAAVLGELKSGRLTTNELVAHALPVADWRRLTAKELACIFSSTRNEEDTGLGPMADGVKGLLATADLSSAILLLSAVMTSLPRPLAGKRFARFPETEQPERAWLLHVLPDCFERVLQLLPSSQDADHDVCVEAAERVEALRDTGFTDRAELDRLHLALAQHSRLRWRAALAIAQSEDIHASVSRLTWGRSCLVSFDLDDVPELTRRANDGAVEIEERHVWFSVGMAVVFRGMRGQARAAALRELSPDGPNSERRRAIGAEYLKTCEGLRTRRNWEADDQQTKAEADQHNARFKAEVLENIATIRSGTHAGWLATLLQYAFQHLRQREYTDVDFDGLSTALSPEIAEAFQAGLRMYWCAIAPPNPSDYPSNQTPWVALIALAGVHLSLSDETAIASLRSDLAGKAAQLSVWELNSAPTWLESLARCHPCEVTRSLSPWIVAEAQVEGDQSRRSLETALRCPAQVRREWLKALVPLIASGQIRRRETLDAVVTAARQDGLLTPETVASLCEGKLAASVGADGRISDMAWLRLWMEQDAPAAWAWFLKHLGLKPDITEPELSGFAAGMADLKWATTPLTQATSDILICLHAMLGAHPSVQAATEEHVDFYGPPEKRLRRAIPNAFLATPGPIGHDGLLALMRSYTAPEDIAWVGGRIIEHASLEVAAGANRTVDELRSIKSPFASAPRSEAQLFQQVIARLEEIRKSIEEGPFSERDLFRRGMPEKHLQRWLAAKFRETQNRRFSVHREEEVDDDKQTDIQLSVPAGNVCVEIKPVDGKRKYTAESLTDTLRTQLVGQYLRGYNSSRGVLVLMQLDDKTWNIPKAGRGKPFPALVSYLQQQANSIRSNSPAVHELVVFGIRCIR